MSLEEIIMLAFVRIRLPVRTTFSPNLFMHLEAATSKYGMAFCSGAGAALLLLDTIW